MNFDATGELPASMRGGGGRSGGEHDEHDGHRHGSDCDDPDCSEDSNNAATTAGPVIPPAFREQGNTGPKGVINDYNEAKARMELRMAIRREEAINAAMKMCLTIKPDQQAQKPEEEEDDEDSDEEALRAFRARRIQEIRQSRLPVFGSLRDVSPSEYSDAIDRENPDVYVVVHLYDPGVEACDQLNQLLGQLAIKFAHTKFISMIARAAQRDFDLIGLPALLVYRGGELRARWVPLTSVVGKTFTMRHIELLLAKHNVVRSALMEDPAARELAAEFEDEDN